MQFNSLEFLVFFIVVFFVFWFLLLDNLKLQNIFLLITNYVFYSWWDWRFLFLIVFISSVNYFASIRISNIDPDTPGRKRKFFLLFALITNLGLLGIFKYFNFFAQSAADLLNTIGFNADALTLHIILPIGISFYTFQTMSYTLDVYNTKIEATKDVVPFFAYASFFPLLLAGPIERAGNLLIQFFKKREFKYNAATDGMRQILWGLFKKLVVADRAAIYVDVVFNNVEQHSGITFIVATLFFAFQIYCDFSGYSDIAIGSARLLGFNLTTNFRTPYFSRDIIEFWRRWHISLSSWLRDYLFIPLNLQLRNFKNGGAIISVLTTFLICGLWHGANWTFIIWGLLHGLFIISSVATKRVREKISNKIFNKKYSFLKAIGQITFTFSLVTFSWIFFRSNLVSDAIKILGKIFSLSGSLYIPQDDDIIVPFYALIGILILLLVESRFEFFKDRYSLMTNKNIIIRYAAYSFLILLIVLMGVFDGGQFIYFQF